MLSGTSDFASPTRASCNRQVQPSGTQKHGEAAITNQVDRSPQSTEGSLSWETYRSYSAPTASSLRRSSHNRPFRFVDLPPELRNKVYEYLGISSFRHWIELQDPELDDPSKALPSILQVNKQIRDEAGSYFFQPNTRIGFILDIGGSSILKSWLDLIGPLNCSRLAANPNVSIRFLAGWELPPHNAPETIQTFTMQYAIDAIKTHHIFNACGMEGLVLPAWQFSRASPAALGRWVRTPGATSSSFHATSFHERHLVRLRDTLIIVLEVLSEHQRASTTE